jgi:hypothetical protein
MKSTTIFPAIQRLAARSALLHRISCGLALISVGAVASAADEMPKPFALRATGGVQIALWQASPNPNKPYISQLFAPGDKSVPLLDDSPADHFHHHALMYAIAVDGTDFWAEKGIKNAGRQQPTEPTAARDGDGFTSKLNWLASDGALLIRETRQVRVRATGKDADAVNWLDWQSTLSPAAGRKSVRLSGSHYFGLGMRFLPAWAGKAGFLWQNAAAPPAVGSPEKVTPGQWCAVTCEIDGRQITLLMIDHPGNPRPASWFTMGQPFCYLSATLGLDTKPMELAAGESLTLRYGLAMMAGPADHARLEKLAEAWKNAHASGLDSSSPTS